MGIRLMVEVFDDAPETLTWRERYVLLACAENFNDNTRRGWPAYDGDEERSKRFRRRARCSRGQFYETLRALVEKGALQILVPGHNGKQAVYAIPSLAAAVPVSPKPRRPRAASRSVPVSRTQPERDAAGIEGVPEGVAEPPAATRQCPGFQDTTSRVVSRNPESSVPETGTPTPHVPSIQDLLKDANAAREGWGVWGEGSANAPADADSQPVTASADAPAGDGLRPRGFAAPARKMDQPGTEDEGQPPPVAEVLKSAATGTASERPGVDDLAPKRDQKPPRWRPGQEALRDDEWNRVLGALMDIDDAELNRLETAIIRADTAALSQARAQALKTAGPHDPDREPEAAWLRRSRLYGLIYALRLRPLASWPQGVLPLALCGPETEAQAA